MVAATGARIIAHARARASIPEVDQGLAAGDIVRIGKTIELEVLDTPGHTMSHVCLLSHSDHRAIFCGDTLFNAGAGNCHNGGHPEELYDTFTTQTQSLRQHAISLKLEHRCRMSLQRKNPLKTSR
jgi:hydroxyacylglutathione hydrolase